MNAIAAAQSRIAATPGWLAGWGRQAFQTFVAAQNILLDLTAQQNALAIGVVRERANMPHWGPRGVFADLADKSVTTITGAGKIWLDLAAGESALLAEGVKDGLRLRPAAGAMTDLARCRVETLIEMYKRVLEVTSEQSHASVESFREGGGLHVAEGVKQVARKGLEAFVDTEKKFLDMAAEQVTVATEGKETRKVPKARAKVLTQLARQGVGKFIDAQKSLLDLAIDQFEPNGKADEEEEAEPKTSFATVTQKSVQNFVTAQKSLLDLAVKPRRAAAAQHREAAARPAKRKAAGKRATA